MITDLDPPNTPTGLEYLIYATSPLDVDLSDPIPFLQRPACGYTLGETFTWEIPADAPIDDTGDYTFRVESD